MWADLQSFAVYDVGNPKPVAFYEHENDAWNFCSARGHGDVYEKNYDEFGATVWVQIEFPDEDEAE